MSASPNHEIILVPPVGQTGRDELRQECYSIRINVFHHEQGYPLDAEIDELRLIGFSAPRRCPFPRLWSRVLLISAPS
jgi:hypothetical protein